MYIIAVEVGKDFIIEKRLARNIKEADEIIKTVKEAGVKSYYDECLKYSPVYVKTKKIIGRVWDP